MCGWFPIQVRQDWYLKGYLQTQLGMHIVINWACEIYIKMQQVCRIAEKIYKIMKYDNKFNCIAAF